jgi:tetratricopeptide (TPR) repeat protein
MVIVTTWRGRTAAALRLSLRMTCDDFAAHLGMSARGVAKWEALPDGELALRTQQVLDVALKRADDDVQARFGQLLVEAAPVPDHAPRNTPTLVVPPRLVLGVPHRVTPELLTSLRQGLRHQYTADNLLGPRALLPVITAHAETIEHLTQDANGGTLDNLLRIGAGYAEFAGWLCQDSGDPDTATQWYRRALEWAEAGQDDRMAAFVLTRRAVQAIGTRNGAHAARLAHAAQRDGRPESARVRAIAAQTEALGHAVSKSGTDADRALGLAELLLEDGGATPAADGDPSDGRYCDMQLYLNVTRAKCHLELGRADAAVAAFTTVLDTLPPDYHRDRGQYLSRLAQAYVLAGHPDEACGHAEESLAIAVATGSSRTINDLRSLAGQLGPWPSNPAVAKFHDLLAATA